MRPHYATAAAPARALPRLATRVPIKSPISWQEAILQWLLMFLAGLIRRPLLVVTIVAAIALLGASIGEVQAAGRLQAQVTQARAQNAALRAEIRSIDAQAARDSAPAAIIARARRLGYVPATSSTPQP
jgi:cell division protein FtsB